MNIYLSHAPKDSGLASQLAARLEREGLTVLRPEIDIEPGDNWAKKIGKALEDSDFMVFLLTPGALDAGWLRKDIEFALGSKKYEGRVFSVFAGPPPQAGKDMPWILLRLPHRRIETAKEFGEV